MTPAKRIAAIAGPVLLTVAASMVVNRAEWTPMIAQLSNDYTVVVLAGLLLIAGGAAILHEHRAWTADWRGLVTLLGWLMIVGGIVRAVFFRQAIAVGPRLVQSPTIFGTATLVVFACGAVLTINGWRRNS